MILDKKLFIIKSSNLIDIPIEKLSSGYRRKGENLYQRYLIPTNIFYQQIYYVLLL